MAQARVYEDRSGAATLSSMVEVATEGGSQRKMPTASAFLEDGAMAELVFQSAERRTYLAFFSAGRWTLQNSINIGDGLQLVPFSPENNLIKNEVILLPSEPRIYNSEEECTR
jgi:hypothetical protein